MTEMKAEWQKGAPTPRLNAALAKAQATMAAARKDSTNPHFKSKYADLASCWDAWREAGPPNGLALTQEPLDAAAGVLKLATHLLHESGEERTGVLTFPVAQPTPQGYGSALTYARRYGMQAMTGIAPDDDDGNAASGPAHDPLTREVASIRALTASARTKADVDALTPRFKALPPAEQDALRPVLSARKSELAA